MLRTAVLMCMAVAALGFNLDRSNGPDGRIIVGGSDTDITKYPYQVSVQLVGSHWCGGSIISADYILSAAHCFGYLPLPYSVRVGSSVRNQGGTVHRIAEYIVHKQYGTNGHDFDIALLRLETPITFSAAAQPVTLEAQGDVVAAGTPAVVTGWGDLEEKGAAADILQEVEVPIISNSACSEAYVGITERMICAGFQAGGYDTCQGDSGGPLVANGRQVGIVSFGRGCARANAPGVYARVAALRAWIRENSGL
ncbi:hypothetical protein R5R35_002519 [Gryllus longicercus]|uniref:Peptidase S1 domain-containing protein n=1 Tax=Gryllus longicercus TaxID=2509291 RepID=A0AAN9Z5V5_9ORTH